MKKSKSRAKGFTLVETMMALGLFGLMTAGSIASIPKVREVVVKSERVQIASNLMNNQVESLRILPFEQLESMMTESRTVTTACEVSNVPFEVKLELSQYETALYGNNAIQASVTCVWNVNDTVLEERYWTLFVRDGLSDKNFNG